MKHWYGSAGLVTKLGKVPVIWSLAFGASGALAAGCSSEPIRDGSVEQVGSLGFNLEAAPGVTLNSVTYTISVTASARRARSIRAVRRRSVGRSAASPPPAVTPSR